MNDETKELFDAPWRATNLDYVEDANGFCVCECGTHLTASNIARLPELYGALEEMVDDYCKSCMYIRPRGTLDCKYNESCFARKYLELLKKVRDGE